MPSEMFQFDIFVLPFNLIRSILHTHQYYTQNMLCPKYAKIQWNHAVRVVDLFFQIIYVRASVWGKLPQLYRVQSFPFDDSSSYQKYIYSIFNATIRHPFYSVTQWKKVPKNAKIFKVLLKYLGNDQPNGHNKMNIKRFNIFSVRMADKLSPLQTNLRKRINVKSTNEILSGHKIALFLFRHQCNWRKKKSAYREKVAVICIVIKTNTKWRDKKKGEMKQKATWKGYQWRMCVNGNNICSHLTPCWMGPFYDTGPRRREPNERT